MGTLLSRAAASTVAQVAKVAIAAAATAAIPWGPGVAATAGDLAKDIFDELLAATSETERMVNALVMEPLRSGLQHMRDAADHPIGRRARVS